MSSLSDVPLRISVRCTFVVDVCVFVLSTLFVRYESTSFTLLRLLLNNAFVVVLDANLLHCFILLDFMLVDAYALRDDDNAKGVDVVIITIVIIS